MAKELPLSKRLDVFLNEKFDNLRLEEALGDRFGRYSKYIIQERAIPDVRDGLKPVQRRILYGMNAMKVFSTAPYKKSARIVGEVMGKYHPHGDSSIYEALVRMSQSWKMEIPLIDMHGNNGSIDGDGPAASRYTETRLSKYADYLLSDIDKNTVPFVPNYDDEEIEPTVLPAKFPNLLVNGSMGISSGYATYIPTHNINEVLNATIALIDNPNLSVDELLEILPGPDFPTGGIVQGKDKIREAFLTGSGAVVVKSKYHIEEAKDGSKKIIIDEIPYDTVKSKTVAKMEQLRIDGKVPDVIEVRDESGREGLRISIDLKKNANVDAILAFYFKNTELQINCNYNMVSICDRKPMKLGVIPILNAYINHEKEVITNRTNYLLIKANKRLIIVDGLLKMIDVVDEVIKIIRKSENKQDSIDNLVKAFQFLPEQAEAIVMMRLYSLSHQDIDALNNEKITLNKNIEEYNKILSSEKELLKVIKNELKEVNKALVVPRKTVIEDEVTNLKINEEDLVTKEQTLVAVSRDGYVKRTSLKSFNASKTNGLKENDAQVFLHEQNTLDTILLFTNLGNYVYLPVYKIPEMKFKEIGEYISTLIKITPGEKIISVHAISSFNEPKTFVLLSKKGNIKQTSLKEFEVSRYTKEIRCMRLSDDELVSTDLIKDPLEVLIFTKDGEALRFRATDFQITSTSSGGVKGINLKNGDQAVSVIYANKNDDFLIFTNKDTVKRMKVEDIILTKRSRSGSRVIPKNKTNPNVLIDVEKLTPNQYKENKVVHLVYRNGSLDLNAFDFKYSDPQIGKQISSNGLKKGCYIFVDDPDKEDAPVSPEYLIEAPKSIFNDDFGMEEEKPIPVDNSNDNIFDDLEKILQYENEKKNNNNNINNNPSPLKAEEEKDVKEEKKIPYKKISLFDDEE